MKTLTTMIAAWLLVAVPAMPGAQNTAQAEKLLENARHQEVVNGDLKAAIEQYRKIAAQFAKQPEIAAQALYRLGQCQEKLGQSEARKAYEQIVRDYGSAQQYASMARTRLVALGNERSGVTYRQVWAGPKVETSGSISPDGRYLSYTDWNKGSLLLHDFSTGSDRLLTNKGTGQESDGYAGRSAISRDGKQVAYSWYSENHCELRVATLQTSGFLQPRRLMENAEVNYLVSPYDWAPDSKWIAVAFWRKGPNAQFQLGLVSTQDGSLRVLKSFNGFYPTNKVSFSPDGKYLATDISTTEDSADGDVSILAVDGSGETKAVVNPGPDFLMGWSPDGKRLLFASSRTGSMGLWAVPISGGKPTGLPEMLRAEISPSSLGVSSAGALYVQADINTKNIGIATLDLEAGRLVASAASPIQTHISNSSQPDWSPDGKHLAYVTERSPADEDRVLVVRSMETGQTRELRPKLRRFHSPSWSPDGRSIAMPGHDYQNRRGIYRIDAATGEARPVTFSPGLETSIFPRWSPDGKKIYFLRVGEQPRLIEHDLVSGTERELIRRPMIYGVAPAVLPDGRSVAILSASQDKSSAVLLIPIAGGEPRELIRANAPEYFYALMICTRDGKGILVQKNGPGRTELLLVPVGGGPPRKLDNSIPNFRGVYLCMHPDGKQIAYLDGEFKSEVWVLENFLPSK